MKNLVHKGFATDPIVQEIIALFNDLGLSVVLKKTAKGIPSILAGAPPVRGLDINFEAFMDGHSVYKIGCVREPKDVAGAIKELKPAVLFWLSEYTVMTSVQKIV